MLLSRTLQVCLLEHLPAQPQPSLGGGLVERISDGEPTERQVPDTTLDNRLKGRFKEGITYLEHLSNPKLQFSMFLHCPIVMRGLNLAVIIGFSLFVR